MANKIPKVIAFRAVRSVIFMAFSECNKELPSCKQQMVLNYLEFAYHGRPSGYQATIGFWRDLVCRRANIYFSTWTKLLTFATFQNWLE